MKKTSSIITIAGAVILIVVAVILVSHWQNSRPTESENASSSNSQSSDKNSSSDTPQISKDQAADIVKKQYGGTILNVESDSHDGSPAWEVEVSDSKEGRIEVDVDKATGKIVEMEKD